MLPGQLGRNPSSRYGTYELEKISPRRFRGDWVQRRLSEESVRYSPFPPPHSRGAFSPVFGGRENTNTKNEQKLSQAFKISRAVDHEHDVRMDYWKKTKIRKAVKTPHHISALRTLPFSVGVGGGGFQPCANHLAGENLGGARPPPILMRVLSSVCGRRGKIWTLWADLENAHHFWVYLAENPRKNRHIFCARAFGACGIPALLYLVWWYAKNPTYGRTMGMYLEKLTFNSRLDTSRKHVAHGGCTRIRSTNNDSSELLQLARVVLLAWFAVHCAFWKSESLSQGLGLSKPVWSVEFWISSI